MTAAAPARQADGTTAHSSTDDIAMRWFTDQPSPWPPEVTSEQIADCLTVARQSHGGAFDAAVALASVLADERERRRADGELLRYALQQLSAAEERHRQLKERYYRALDEGRALRAAARKATR